MDASRRSRRRRVLVPQALGSDEFLRVTWHEDRAVVVFSQWEGGRCIAAIPVRVDDIDELTELMVDSVVGASGSPWPAPDPARLVVPEAGLTVPPNRLTA